TCLKEARPRAGISQIALYCCGPRSRIGNVKSIREGPMLTRRNFVTRAIAAGVLLRTEGGFAKASQPSTAVNFEIPRHACDCHKHFYGDQKEFPLSPAHLYTPENYHPEDMTALHRALHMERVVIVTPSVYGPNNNGSTLFGIKARGATARGIAVVDDKTPDADFDAMYRAGVRGAR